MGKPETNLDRKIELIVPCSYIPMKVRLMGFFFLYNLCFELDCTINTELSCVWGENGKWLCSLNFCNSGPETSDRKMAILEMY